MNVKIDLAAAESVAKELFHQIDILAAGNHNIGADITRTCARNLLCVMNAFIVNQSLQIEALKKFTMHKPDCNYLQNHTGEIPCSCGLAKLLMN